MGNPFVHVELQTQDPAKAKAFYAGLFDWKLEGTPGMDYTMIGVEGGTGGGIMKHPMAGAPSQWLAYVLVNDVATATEKAKRLGATVLRGKSEVPNYGWFSVIADPTGAVLGLWERKAASR